MPYFSVNIVPRRPNIVKKGEQQQGFLKFNPPYVAFKPIGQLDLVRLDAGYDPGSKVDELLTGVFVDLSKPVVLRHEGKEYPVGPGEEKRRMAFFFVG